MTAELFLYLNRKIFSKRKPGQENTGIYLLIYTCLPVIDLKVNGY